MDINKFLNALSLKIQFLSDINQGYKDALTPPDNSVDPLVWGYKVITGINSIKNAAGKELESFDDLTDSYIIESLYRQLPNGTKVPDLTAWDTTEDGQITAKDDYFKEYSKLTGVTSTVPPTTQPLSTVNNAEPEETTVTQDTQSIDQDETTVSQDETTVPQDTESTEQETTPEETTVPQDTQTSVIQPEAPETEDGEGE